MGAILKNLLSNELMLFIKAAFLDKTDKKKYFVAVQVKFKEMFKKPVTLENIKKDRSLSQLPMIKQSRLSVMAIDSKNWKKICC